MYLLIEKSTGITRDTQSQPFAVTSDFEWVEDKSISDNSHVGEVYNKQTKVFSSKPIITRPRELTQAQITAKIDALQAQVDSVAQPVLGAVQPQTQQSNAYLYIAVTALIFLTFWVTRLKYKK